MTKNLPKIISTLCLAITHPYGSKLRYYGIFMQLRLYQNSRFMIASHQLLIHMTNL